VIAGHFGFAAAVKSRETSTPLWALMLATVWMDVVFVPLLAAGVETIGPAPGTSGGYGAVVIHADYTHSLVGALIIAAAFGAVATWPWGRRVGLVLGAVVFSHWLLDLPMHRHDMPLLPGAPLDAPRVGFGLWAWPVASAVLELALVVAGAWLYRRAALETAQRHGAGAVRRANVISACLLAAGVLTLALNVAGQ
jgi:hypothetical protein